MKLTVNQSLDIKENEIIINCSVMDDRLKKLVDMIRQYSFSLKATAGGEKYNIPLENIIYIDSVEGNTFLYCTNKIYEYKDTLMSLELKLQHTSFLRISKNCIMNLNALKSVHASFNHTMEATLNNGEKLIVSRKYIENLKKKLDE